MNFLSDYYKLKLKFPFIPSVGFGNTKSEYSDNLFNSNACYYVFESAEMENCLYTADGFRETGDIDCEFGLNGNQNYECLDFADSTNCYKSQSFARCYNIWYSWYCTDCHDCFGCANLSNKEYCIFNIQYTKDEYESKIKDLKKLPEAEIRLNLKKLINQIPQLNAEQINNVNSDYCDYAYNNNNCYYCFDSANNQDSGYISSSYECKDCWDCSNVVRSEQSAECSYSGDLYNCYHVTDCSRCHDSYFLEDCSDCHDCFGCVKLSHKSYCILNVQYTKEEYFVKIKEIKRELGQYFQEPVQQS